MTGGCPVILAFPVLLMLSPTCMRMPALVESLGGQPAQPVGTLSVPLMLTLPATRLVPPDVTAAWILTASGRKRARKPSRGLAPPPRTGLMRPNLPLAGHNPKQQGHR